LSGDARLSRGGSAGDAAYYTGTFALAPMTALGLEVHARTTRYRTDRTTGWLHSVSAGVDPFGFARLEIDGGLRTQQLLATTTSATPTILLPNARWIGASADISVGRSWYVLLSGTRDGTGPELTNQVYCSLVFRF
jgi:hypothetical protein